MSDSSARPVPPTRRPHQIPPKASRTSDPTSNAPPARPGPDKPFTQADYDACKTFTFDIESPLHDVQQLRFTWDSADVSTMKYEMHIMPRPHPADDRAHVQVFNAERAIPVPVPVPKAPHIERDRPTPSRPTPASAFAYKKVENRVKPVATTLPEHFRIERRTPSDPLASLPTLPHDPPPFVPGARYTQERMEALNVNPEGFLSAAEERLVHHIVLQHENGFAWTEDEKGQFSSDYFDDVVIPTIEHMPWALRNIPIPPGIYDRVIEVIKAKIASGIYQPSSSSYRSRWFCVLKKDGKSLRIVHDLQPLNAVTIKDSGLPPMVEQYAESFGARGCYGMFDLFVGFDQRKLADISRDLTTFQTPLGTFRLTSIPMGYTNSMQIQHGDTTYLLQDEIPEYTIPFVDDVPVKGPPTRYELPGGDFERIPENPEIRRFVWEHLQNVNRIIQRIKHAGGTFSGPKSTFCAPTALVVGHRCTYEGRVVDESRIQAIRDWPPCTNLTEVRGFLGTLGTVRMFIKGYAMHAKPLVNLTRKGVDFVFDEEHLMAMEKLKHLAITSPAIRAIDYASGREVILAVDSSWMAVGYILAQLGADKLRYPARFGSITFNDREQRYSQAKLELYGLFRALKAMRTFIIGVPKLIVEVDAKYIKGMINNPDIQPNATINRWIAGILLFDFTLRHVPGKDHASADGLSRRARAPEDPPPDEDGDDWIDSAYSFAVSVMNGCLPPLLADTRAPRSRGVYMSAPSSRSRTPVLSPSALVMSIATANVVIPRHPKAVARDAELLRVRAYLEDPTQLPSDLAAMPESPARTTAVTRFIRRASDFFVLDKQLWKKHHSGNHKLVIDPARRFSLLVEAHTNLGHKGVFTVRLRLLERFWWPALDEDVKWFIKTCHECQLRLTRRVHIPPTVPPPSPLFRKFYIDTFLMPPSNGYRYVVHARCSMSSYPEAQMLRNETAAAIGSFIFDQLLCRYGPIEEIATDNAPQYIAAVKYLVDKYHIHHIRVSPYNSQAQGPIERKHYDVREALLKATDGHPEVWPGMLNPMVWAERATVTHSTGYSPYYIAHGLEVVLPFDLAEGTYLSPIHTARISTEELIATRARMLQKRPEDLERVRLKVQNARWAAVREFERKHASSIVDFDFKPGSLVLVRNSRADKDLTKHRPRYLGPMFVVRRTTGGSYILAELDGAVSRLRFGASRLLPYAPRDIRAVPVSTITGLSPAELDAMTYDGVTTA